MSESVLVGYATRYGSTREVAEVVAAVLGESGFEADMQAMRKVRTLASYRAVVIGAPLYFGGLHKDAPRFLLQQRQALLERPVAMFALGPIHEDEKEWQEGRAQLEGELAKYPWLTLVALEMFGGKFDPAKLRFPDNLIARLPASPLHNQPASDARNWAAIRAWANDLALKLQSSLS